MKSKAKFTVKQLIFFALAFLAVTFSSCQEEPGGGGPVAGIRYLESNDLNKMQLKGAVKFVQIKNDGMLMESWEFNARGNIVKCTRPYFSPDAVSQSKEIRQPIVRTNAFEKWITGKAAVTSRTSSRANFRDENYTYDASGRLTGIYGRNGSDTILLSYGNHNAYIPFPLKFGIDDDMLQNLSRIIYKQVGSTSIGTTDIKFVPEGEEIKVYSESSFVGRPEWGETRDTLTIRFNASKLPVFYTNNFAGVDVTLSYYPDNMLKEEIMSNVYSDKTYITRTLFEPGLTYPLVKEVEMIVYENGQQNRYGRCVYSYNEQKDLEKVSLSGDDYSNNQVSTYTYDDHGNWIRRKTVYLDESGKVIYENGEITRTITYY